MVIPPRDSGGMWDFAIKMKVGRIVNMIRKYSRASHIAVCLHQGQSAPYLLEVQSNKNFLLVLRAAVGYTSFSVNCCGYPEDLWQKKHTSIQHSNAELADNTKVPTFSCALFLFLSCLLS